MQQINGEGWENFWSEMQKGIFKKLPDFQFHIEVTVRGTFKSKAPLRVQFSPPLGGEGVGKG